MIRRLLIATAAALIVSGGVGARLGLARQQPAPAPAAPLPIEPGGERPPTSGDPDAPAGKAKAKAKPANAPAPADPFLPEGSAEPAPIGPAPEAKTDEDVMKVQAPPAGDGSNLPPAKEPPGGAPAAAAGPAPDPKWILPADRLKAGPNTAALTVEVQAPPNANLNRPVKLKISVRNTGQGPAMGVMVYDALPEGLEFQKSEPPAASVGNILVWQLESLAAGAEKVIAVTVIPHKTGDFDHSPTVTLRTGSRARTMVKAPKLKVEILNEESGKVLKGRPVSLSVRVTNTGTGPASAVKVHADLTPGLKHESGSAIEVSFKEHFNRDALGPGESETIPLEVDAAAAGDQSCKIFAESPDVEDSAEAHAEVPVTVVEPRLELDFDGSRERYTDTEASYTLTVSNPGTATARNVVAGAFLPNLDGRLVDRSPSEVKWIAKERKLYWAVGDLEPGSKKEMKFKVQLGGVGIYKVDAATKADGCPYQSKDVSTHVVGMPDIKCQVVARTKVLDVGEETVYEVQLKNAGSKEATNLLVSAVLTENLDIVQSGGTQSSAKSSGDPQRGQHDALFPPISLAPGAEQVLWLRIKATKAGQAECTVKVQHDESVIKNSTTTKVMAPR